MNFRTILGTAALALSALFSSSAAQAAVVDLGFSLDGSGSVSSADYTASAEALSQALGSIPTSGDTQYRIAVTSYGSSVTTIVEPTIVTADNIADIQDDVANATKAGGGTRTDLAITETFELFEDSADGLGDTTLINITTDGFPNSQTATENAALAAFNAGLDGLSFEAVGAGVSSESAQNNLATIAGLGTAGDASNGVVLTDTSNIPDATETGFVIPVSDFDAYEGAILAKVDQIVDDTGGGGPSVIPLPAGLPLLLTGLGVFGLLRRRAATAA